jgi:hypothetical protein
MIAAKVQALTIKLSLRQEAPDLAALVGEDRMSLAEAIGAMDARARPIALSSKISPV